jgi:hypothetical protein
MIRALMSSAGAVAFVVGVALLAFDAVRSLNVGSFDATSFQVLWVNLGFEQFFPLRFNLSQWFGSAADSILELPAAFVTFGLGMALMIIFDGAQRDRTSPSL